MTPDQEEIVELRARLEALRVQDEHREDETLELKRKVRELELYGTKNEIEAFYAMKRRALAAEEQLKEIDR